LINWTLAKLKNRESEKDTVKRMKGQTIDWEKISVNYISRMYKKLEMGKRSE
jgi:hypothetical protein